MSSMHTARVAPEKAVSPARSAAVSYLPGLTEQPMSMISKGLMAVSKECWYCGNSFISGDSNRGRSIDHVHPRSLGGGDEIGNLALACRRCNVLKGGFPEQYLRNRLALGMINGLTPYRVMEVLDDLARRLPESRQDIERVQQRMCEVGAAYKFHGEQKV